MPTRSSGCYTCRKRKIRCDEARPGCKRCTTHGVQCPGYRTEKAGGVEFRDQTRDVVKKARVFHDGKGRKVGEGERSGVAVGMVLTPESFIGTNDEVAGMESDSENSLSELEKTGTMTMTMAKGRTWQSPVGDSVYSAQPFTNSLLPATLMSPTANRSQLYATFVDIYLPKKTGPLDHFSFYETIANQPTEQTALLESLDALSLVSVGSLRKDRAILNESVRAYGQAMSSLVKAFSRPENAHDDDLLAATTVLTSCALYDEIGQHDVAWGKHVNGTQQLIAARGPQSLQTPLAMLLFSNTRHAALVWALIERKAPYMALPEWREMAFRAPIQDSSTLFYDAAIQIPGLLERKDQLGASLGLSTHNVDAILADCAGVEQVMREWYVDWNVQAALNGITIFEERPIDEFETFAGLVKDRTFETGYKFPGFPMAYLSGLYWMCMHFLRITIQELHTVRHALDEDWYPDPEQAVSEPELFDYAVNLCKYIPFCCEPISSSTGHVGIFLPMRTAAVHFTQHGQWQYARWVGNVRNKVFTKGLSPPMIGNQPGMLKGLDKIVLRQHEKMFPWKSGRDPQPGSPFEWKEDEVCNVATPHAWAKSMGAGAFNLHQD